MGQPHHRAEVPLPVHKRISQREILGKSNEGVVNGDFAVRMVVPRGIAADFHRFAAMGIGVQPQVVIHDVEDASLNRLQSVTDIGQGTGCNHRKGVVQVSSAGFLTERDVLDTIGVEGTVSA